MDRSEYDRLYRNAIEQTSSSEEESSEEEIEETKNVSYEKKIFNFLIDSSDRNWYSSVRNREVILGNGSRSNVSETLNGLEINTFDFRVKFGNASNSIENTSIFNPKEKKNQLISQKFYGIESLAFPINIRNIESIRILSVIMPKRLMYLGEADYCDILDFRYLLVCIEEISNTIYGTHNDINKSMAVLYPLSVVYHNSQLKQVEFVEKSQMVKTFSPAPLNSINNLRISIKDPNGNQLRFKNDILNISSMNISGNYITITTVEYFNQEYKNGDILKIKNFTTTDNADERFINFINREKGHKMYLDTEFNDTDYNTVNSLQNTFRILVPGDYENENYSPVSYLSSMDTTLSSSGEILNTNMQLSMLLKIESKIMKFDSLNTQII